MFVSRRGERADFTDEMARRKGRSVALDVQELSEDVSDFDEGLGILHDLVDVLVGGRDFIK
jgi:hypothetical protein